MARSNANDKLEKGASSPASPAVSDMKYEAALAELDVKGIGPQIARNESPALDTQLQRSGAVVQTVHAQRVLVVLYLQAEQALGAAMAKQLSTQQV